MKTYLEREQGKRTLLVQTTLRYGWIYMYKHIGNPSSAVGSSCKARLILSQWFQCTIWTSWNSATRSSLTPLFLFFLQGGGDFDPVVVGRSVLESPHHSEVLVKQLGAPLGNRYYRFIIPDFPITICSSCNKVYYLYSQGEERYLFQVEHVYIDLADSCHFVVEDTIHDR